MALALVMVLSLLPATALPALAAENESSGTKDAFGITMSEWTAAEKAEAEANLPFGTGYGSWTTLLEKSELFFSMGYDNETRLTGMFDWNEKSTATGTLGDIPDSAIGGNIIGFSQGKLTSLTENFKAVATAPMDLYGTGRKEYVANLALNADGNTLYLYVTDSNNKMVGVTRKIFENVAQLSGMEVHQIKGAFSITAGDFDGDGKDTIVVYVPQTDSGKYTKNGTSPFIAEFSVTVGKSGGLIYTSYDKKSTVSSNVLTLLGNNEINQITTMKNQPMVDLMAEDVDRDGFDELIVTAGMNDVTNSDHFLESRIFIYDKLSSKTSNPYTTGDGNWNCSYDKKMAITSESNKRVVWASSTVGNIMVSTSTTTPDYPEIISAGFIDDEQSKTQHINVGDSNKIGVTAVRVKIIQDKTNNKFTNSANGKSLTTVNVICKYEEVLNQKLSPNAWTKDGFYENEDVNSLLQVQAYADRGLSYAEAVFISGSVYHINNDNKLEEEYKHTDFGNKDQGADGDTLTNLTITAVTAGNFNGNDDGREQLIFVTTLKQSGHNNAYSRVYCYYYDTTLETKDGKEQEHGYEGKRSSYLTKHKGAFYVSLSTLDTDKDSVIARLESVSRDFSRPDVLAILEAPPYFGEIEDAVGNSETTYGTGSSSGSGSSNSFGFTLGSSVGYEFESTLTQSGGGFEVAIERSYNWSTANTTTVEWFTEFRNDSGDNLVVVYRCPVVTYQYVDQNGKKLVVEKVGQPATSMISVDDYNAAAEQWDGLDTIEGLGQPGDPSSYRSVVDERTMKNAVTFNGVGKGDWDSAGWTQYFGKGSVMQGLTITKEQEKTFSYDLGVSLNIFAKVGGVTASATFGFAYAHEQTHINGSSVTKSGAVYRPEVEGYDFQWKFAAWNCTLNGGTVPVIGYLVKDVVAPPSPPAGLAVESFTTNSVTLRWSSGIRAASQYRIYRVLDTGDTDYVLVGAVQGDETSCTLTGLKPGETYTYVVRGVDYTRAVESVDSAPVTVRTQSEASNVTITLHSTSLTGSTLQSNGVKSTISAQVTGTSGSIAYQWQLLNAGTAGVWNGWVDVSTLAGKTIGKVTNAKSGTLTMENIDKSLDGSSLRCVVTVTSTAGDVDTYYSPIVTLDLNGLDTTTKITVTGTDVTGSGSMAGPYVGTPDYDRLVAGISVGIMIVPATIEQDGITYTIYQDATDPENPVYVGVYDQVDTENDTITRAYYAVTKNADGTFTLGGTLHLNDDQYLDDNGTYTVPDGFDGLRSLYEDVTEEDDTTVRYEKRYVVATDDTGLVTLTEYWYNTSNGRFYTRAVVDETVTFTLADPQPDKTVDDTGEETATNADIRMAYYDNSGTVILSAAGADGYDHYEVYTSGENGYTMSGSFYRLPGTLLYSGETEYADSAKLETVTVEKEVSYTTITTVPEDGTELTLSANVTLSGSGENAGSQVTFTITNTDTGAVTQLTANSGGTATWTAPKRGLYRIVATAAATTTTKSSSATCYYWADDPTNNYRLVVRQGSEQITNISYNGSPVTLELEERSYDSQTQSDVWERLDSGVSFKVNGTAIDGSSYTPNAAGSYLFSAVADGKTLATAVLVVNKVAITVTPTWDSAGDATNTVPAYSDIKLVVTDAQGETISGLVDDVMKVSCALYNGTSIKPNAATGVYTVTPAFVSADAEKLFRSRYSVTLKTGTIYYFSAALTVYFSAGENGTLSARYIDPSGTEFSFENGSQISMDYGLKFIAEPLDGWLVEKWTAVIPMKFGSYNLKKDLVADGLCSRYGNTLEISGENMEQLKSWISANSSLIQKQITVSVSFTDQTHEILFSAGEGGSLTATTGGAALISGASVAHNASVTFTAAPNAGKMVEKWIVDGVEYKWDGTNSLYRENTLTLENMDSDHVVKVTFTDAGTTNVIASAVDTDGAQYPSATVTVTDAQGNTLTGDALRGVSQSAALTFTAKIDNKPYAVVKEWQTSSDGTTWTAVAGSGGQDSITIYEHGATLRVRVVIAVAQAYTLSWNVTGLDAGDRASLIALSGGEVLNNGGTYAANTQVTFCLEVDGKYYVVEWTNAEQSDSDPTTATLTLTQDSEVTVTVAKNPVIRWANLTNRVITVKGWVNGTEQNITSGSYVDHGTDITVTVTPDEDYVVTGIHTAQVNSGKANGIQSETFTDITADQTITATLTEKPTVIFGDSLTGGSILVSGTLNGTEKALASGDHVDFGSSLTITATPDDGYVVDTINNVAINAGRANGSKTAENVIVPDDGLTVSATFLAKPTVTIATVSGGTVQVTGTKDGAVDTAIRDGDYVDFGSSLTVTLIPAKGFEVSGPDAGWTALPNSDTYTYSIDVGTDCHIAPVFTAIPAVEVTYSVVDTNGSEDGGTNGTLTASVTRKGMPDYAVTDDHDGTETVYRDSVVTFTATPADGYKISKWFVNGTEQSNQPELTIQSDEAQDVQVQFDPVGEEVTFGFDTAGVTDQASLSAVYQANGSTEKEPFFSGNKPVANGTITFTVSDLADGYEVEGWYVNGVKQKGQTDLTYAYSVTANVGADVKVRIVRSSYTVTFSGENGTVTAVAGGNAIRSGGRVVGDTEVIFTAAPVSATGYSFSGWTVNGEALEQTAESLTLTITGYTVVKAVYTLDEVRYTVTYGVIGENGALSAQTLDDENTAAAGSDVVFTATPADGYRVKGWYRDAGATMAIPGTTFEQNSYTLENLLADTSVYVAFEPIPTYDITVTVTGLGTVTATVNGVDTEITDNKLTVTRYDDVVLTAIPDTYHYLTGWTLDGTGLGNGSMTLNLTAVTEDHTVTAGFAASQLVSFRTVVVNAENGTLTAKAGYGEALTTINAATGISVEKGKKVVVTAVPDAGYMVKTWTVNGVAQDNLSNTLTIENLSEATVVAVEFEALKLWSITGSYPGCTFTIDNRTPDDYGTPEQNQIRDRGNVTFTVRPDEGKRLIKLTVNGIDCLNGVEPTGTTNSVIAMVNSDGTITVTVGNVTHDIALAAAGGAEIVIAEDIANGKVTASHTYAQEGDTVTLTVEPNKGYALETLLVTDQNGDELALTDMGDGQYTFPMPGSQVTVNATFMEDNPLLDYFVDVPVEAYYYDAVLWAAEAGITVGTSDGTFSPYEPCTRAQAVTLLWRAAGCPTPESSETPFEDVVKGSYYEMAVLWAVENGITSGTSDTTFSPYDICSRAHFATFLWRAQGMPEAGTSNPFTDVAEDAYYYDAVLWAAAESIALGTSTATFSPYDPCTRAQTVTFLYRCLAD